MGPGGGFFGLIYNNQDSEEKALEKKCLEL